MQMRSQEERGRPEVLPQCTSDVGMFFWVLLLPLNLVLQGSDFRQLSRFSDDVLSFAKIPAFRSPILPLYQLFSVVSLPLTEHRARSLYQDADIFEHGLFSRILCIHFCPDVEGDDVPP